jgi:drug/metabolite transporter (DMT)-like permease
MVVFGGGNPVAVRFSNSGLPPFWGATLRFVAAAVIFWILVLVRRLPLPRGRALLGAVVYGLLSIGAAYAALYWGLLRASAGLAGAILALVPLLTLFFAAAHGVEKLRWPGVVGAVVATAGVVFGVVGGFGGSVYVPSVLALVAGVACLAEASIVFKLLPQSDPMVTNAVSLTTGVPLLAALSLLTGEQWALPTALDTWAAFAYLALVGSVGVFYLYLRVLSQWTASATSYAFLLIPVATVIIAAWLLGEVITLPFIIGAALVLAGVWIGAIRRAPPETADLTCAEMPSKAIC